MIGSLGFLIISSYKNELCITGLLWAIFQSDFSKEAFEDSGDLL